MAGDGSAKRAIIAQIIRAWRRLTDEAPWTRLTGTDRIDHVLPLIGAVIEWATSDARYRTSALDRSGDDAKLEALATAILHGADRREQGFTEDELLQEYYRLRLAVWRVAREHVPAGLPLTHLSRADALVSALAAASVNGFHRRELVRSGAWKRTVREMRAALPMDEPRSPRRRPRGIDSGTTPGPRRDERPS